jgi:hypothetical protein
LWETTGVASKRRKRIPKKGDRVTAHGQNGVFVIYSIDNSLCCVELKLIGGDFALSSIPWRALTFLDEQYTSIS